MDSNTTSRNKARDIESEIVSRIAAQGVTAVAKKLGVDKSQVSRWQSRGGLVEKASCLLAAIGYEQPAGMVIFKGDETGQLAQCLIGMLDHLRTQGGEAGE
ncbi:lambda phage CII family protein [Pantoea dispersa]|uniref:CII family transcriptional regulator n=1 Tax=Pantoea TaxID=53335 RepID=UPI001CCB8D20|nr:MULTISPECIES: CII family transcriptional regulator [Pantoea]MCT6589206.1 lambda phage CII family protein [Pantoea dispersa]UBN55284.1 lambda phage CII family protein [Pantoea agglomerans]